MRSNSTSKVSYFAVRSMRKIASQQYRKQVSVVLVVEVVLVVVLHRTSRCEVCGVYKPTWPQTCLANVGGSSSIGGSGSNIGNSGSNNRTSGSDVHRTSPCEV